MAIGIILISIFLVAVLSYERYTSIDHKQSVERTHQIIDQLSLNVDNYLHDLFKLSLLPYFDIQLMNNLEIDTSNDPEADLQKQRSIEQFLNTMLVTRRIDILRAYLVTDKVYVGGRAEYTLTLPFRF